MKIPVDAVIPEPKLRQYLLVARSRNINRDFPSDNLVKGDIAILNDYVTDRSGQEGCVLEIYTVAGDFVGVVTLPADSIEPLQASDRLSVRKLINA